MRAAIVDPYSSGALLASEFAKRGCECVMVPSTTEIPPMYRSSCDPQDFVATIEYCRDVDETCRALEPWDVSCVIPGCELGVQLADQLSERLGLTTNGTRLTAARRNKYLMAQAAREHGIPAPAYCSSRDLDKLIDWVRSHGRFPYVVKPVDSTGSDGVQLCTSDTEIRIAFERIMNQRNVFGSVNEAVLLQEYVDGTQFAVDTVSWEGQHRLAAYWKYGKPAPGSSFFGCDSVELLSYDETLHRRLFPLVCGALDALEIRYGPAHCEVITTDHTSRFIEIGARLNGGRNPELVRLCGGRNQTEMTVDAYLEPTRFLAVAEPTYELSRYAMRVFLTPNRQGQLQAINGLAEIERLPSFHEMYVSDKMGQAAPRIVGWVVLIHPDPVVIQNDLQRIRLLERQDFYDIEPDE